MTEQPRNPVKPKRPWLKIMLATSVALNLLFVGFLAGAAARHSGDGAPNARAPGLGAFGAPYMRALPTQERRAVLRSLRDAAQGNLPGRGARRAKFQEVLELLRAQPFDAEALTQAVTEQASTAVFVQQTAQNAWLEVVSNMSESDRRAYADAVERVLKDGRKR